METIKVKAAPGVRVPKENAHRKYITDSEAVVVNATPYYLLRIRDKDLMRVDETTSDSKADEPTASEPAAPVAPAANPQGEALAADDTADATTADHNEVQ